MNNLSETFGLFIAGIFLIAFMAVLMAFPTMWLWNLCLAPAVDGVNSIGLWQALGLNLLFSILFKSTTKTTGNEK